jgi:hypothetical protein
VTNAEVIAAFGERIWGAGWVAGLSHFADINPRTLRRIHAAAACGEDYPAARGVIGALDEALAAAAADLQPWVRRADAGDGGGVADRPPIGR